MVGRANVWAAVFSVMAFVSWAACGSRKQSEPQPVPHLPSQNPDGGPPDTPVPDAGPAPDGGPTPDAGPGTIDAGTIVLPNTEGWQFLGPQNGGPREVLGVTSDAAGNVWVAGGDEGLFLLAPGQSSFKRFTVADGLTGYNDGTGVKAVRVISVAGGPANTVFVGYEGLPGCQDAFERVTGASDPLAYQPHPELAYLWKAGDADRVTWNGSALSVTHYDISSGEGIVAAEMVGREKLCSILRIAYDAKNQNLWFGGNHGVAWGDPNGKTVIEHTHPSINGYIAQKQPDGSVTYHDTLLTDAYYGLSVNPSTGALWLGGANRSAYFDCSDPNRFWVCDVTIQSTKVDFWPDLVPEDSYPNQRVDDNVSDMAAAADGSVWASSYDHGLVHWPTQGPPQYLKETSVEPNGRATALELDPADGSLWIGFIWGGLSRLKDGHVLPYSSKVFGNDIIAGPVVDIQSDTYSQKRRILVAFKGSPPDGKPGVVGIYTGP